MKFFRRIPLLALCFFIAFPSKAETPATSQPAESLIAERENETCIEELKDLILRREKFLEALEALPENERSRRAADLAGRFEAHLARFPDSFPGLYYFADLLRLGGENARAEELLLRAEKLAPDLAPIQLLLAEILAEKGEAESAFRRFKTGLETSAPEAENLALYGEFLNDNRAALLAKKCFGSRAELDENMQEAFRFAAILSGEKTEFYWRYAESFYDVENPNRKAALRAWEDVACVPAVKKSPELLAAVALHRARALAELGRIDEANTILRETVGFPALERSRRQVFEIILQKRKTN